MVQSPLLRWKSLKIQPKVSSQWCFFAAMASAVFAPLFSEILSQYSHLRGDFKALNSSFCWQDWRRWWFNVSSRTWLLPTTAKITKSWLTDQYVTVSAWPASSWDVNPTTKLKSFVTRKMSDSRPRYTDELKSAIKATWAFVSPPQSYKLIMFMLHCVDAVVHAVQCYMHGN